MDLFHLAARLTLDTSSYEKSIGSAMSKGRNLASSLTSLLGKLVTGATVAKMAQVGFVYNTQIEEYTTNFKVMLGSVEEAAQRVETLKNMAAKTPFGLADLADATQTLLAFQVDADKTTDILSMLGDIALGDAQKLSSLALVFGQVSSAGKLTGQDLMQFINVGFNPLNYIAERTGESMEKLRKRMSEGKITVAEITQAFRDATSEGGQFYQGMAESSKTTSGLWSTLQDDWSAFLGGLMDPVNDVVGDRVLPKVLDSLGRLSDALFGTGEASDAAKASLFTDKDGNTIDPSAQMKTWYDNLLKVWTDGKTEDDETVLSFTNAFATNTETLRAALRARVDNLTGEFTQEEIDAAKAQLATLSQLQGDVEAILTARQGGYLTEEDRSRLESMLAAISEMQAELEAKETVESALAPWEKFVDKLGDISVVGIEKATDLLVWLIDHGAATMEVLKGLAAGFVGIKVGLAALSLFGGPVAAVLAALSAAAVWVVTHWESIKATAEAVWNRIVEVWGQFSEWWNTNIVAPIETAIGKIREFLGLQDQAEDAEPITVKYAPTNVPRETFPEGWSREELPTFGQSHATGLDYVPYDEYPARLHRGEAVLTAMEARNWRGEQIGGMDEEALTRAMLPIVEAIREIRFTLNLDKKALAEATASENRTAIAEYNMRIARGMGK